MTANQPTGVKPAPFTDPHRWPRPVQVIATLALIVLAVTGIALGARALAVASSPDFSPPSASGDVAAAAAAVPWQDYRPGYRAELDADDCAALADVRSALASELGETAELARYGHGNDAATAYVDALRESKGC